MLEVQADVKRHKQPPTEEQRRTRTQQGMRLYTNRAAMLEGALELIQGAKHLQGEQKSQRRIPAKLAGRRPAQNRPKEERCDGNPFSRYQLTAATSAGSSGPGLSPNRDSALVER